MSVLEENSRESLINIYRLKDVCSFLHCNFEIARNIFFEWYLMPFGMNALEDTENRDLCFPLTRAPPIGGAQFNPNDSQSLSDGARKRRRTNHEDGLASHVRPTVDSLSTFNAAGRTISEERDTPAQDGADTQSQPIFLGEFFEAICHMNLA